MPIIHYTRFARIIDLRARRRRSECHGQDTPHCDSHVTSFRTKESIVNGTAHTVARTHQSCDVTDTPKSRPSLGSYILPSISTHHQHGRLRHSVDASAHSPQPTVRYLLMCVCLFPPILVLPTPYHPLHYDASLALWQI